MEQLLCNRWLVCRRADRIAVRRSELIAERPPLRAPEAGAAFSTPSVVHFRSRAVVVSHRERSMACDRRRRSFLGISGP